MGPAAPIYVMDCSRSQRSWMISIIDRIKNG